MFERPPILFIAIASVSCASRESDPSDMAPVEKRLTISLAGSTSSSGTPPSAAKRKPHQAAQRRAARGVVVDEPRVLLVRLRAAVPDGMLEERDRVGVPLVVLAVPAPGVEARDRQELIGRAGVRTGVAQQRVPAERLEPDAADP